MRKRMTVLFISIMMALLMMSGCGDRKPDSEQMRCDLQNYLNLNYYNIFVTQGTGVEITNLEIYNSRANGNLYTASCMLELNNGITKMESTVEVRYQYSDKWLFLGYEVYDISERPMPMYGISEEAVLEQFKGEYPMISTIEKEEDLELGEAKFVLDVSGTTDLVEIEGTLNVYYVWDPNTESWICSNAMRNADYHEIWNLAGTWRTSEWKIGGFENVYKISITNLSDDIFSIQYAVTTKDLIVARREETDYYEADGILTDERRLVLSGEADGMPNGEIYLSPYAIWIKGMANEKDSEMKCYLERIDDAQAPEKSEEQSREEECYVLVCEPTESISEEELLLARDIIETRIRKIGMQAYVEEQNGQLYVYINKYDYTVSVVNMVHTIGEVILTDYNKEIRGEIENIMLVGGNTGVRIELTDAGKAMVSDMIADGVSGRIYLCFDSFAAGSVKMDQVNIDDGLVFIWEDQYATDWAMQTVAYFETGKLPCVFHISETREPVEW